MDQSRSCDSTIWSRDEHTVSCFDKSSQLRLAIHVRFRLYMDVDRIDISGALERAVSDDSEVGEVHFSPSPYFRQSRMPLEVDTIAPQILNRHQYAARNLHNKLEIPTPPLPAEPLVLSVRELWEDERQRRRALGLNPSPEMPCRPKRIFQSYGGTGVRRRRWWEELQARIEGEGGCRNAPHQQPLATGRNGP